MNELIKNMVDLLKTCGAGFVSATVGNYTFIITDDLEGATYLSKSWDEYAELSSKYHEVTKDEIEDLENLEARR